MKVTVSIFIAIAISFTIVAQPPKSKAKSGMTFGAKTIATGALPVNKLAAQLTSEEEKNVKIRGKVVEVCTKEGCWIKLETAEGKMMVKMKDHAFFVPVDLNGKEVVVDGTAQMKVTSVKELQHYEEDAGKSKDEIEAIIKPKKEIVMNATGILVL